MAVFGVMSFIVGVFSLAMLVVRRGRKQRPTALDHLLVFLGTAAVIVGIGVVFMRFTR